MTITWDGQATFWLTFRDLGQWWGLWGVAMAVKRNQVA